VEILQAAMAQLSPPDSVPEWQLRAPQQAAAEALLAGRRVVLRAPAGSGKSFAAWFPWLASRVQPYDFPPQLLHVFPGGTLLGNLPAQLGALAESLPGVRVGVQTEGDPYDPFLLSDAIFTSVDQLLSAALHRPLGLFAGLSNIDAGALFGAYLIFDEFPALASRDALVIWLGLLRRYYPTVPCLFTTAGMPAPLARRIAELLHAEYLDFSDARAGGRRAWSRQAGLGADALLRLHRERTVVVCNTVRGAQTLYRALQAQRGERDPELLLLHQYQLHRERAEYAARADALFAPGSGARVLLVTTSGIESGIDLSADTLVTDPAPPDALLRRAARCARHDGAWGQVIVAPVSEFTPGDAAYPCPPWEALVDALADGTGKSGAEELAALDALWAAAPDAQLPDAVRALPTAEEADAAPGHVLTGADAYPAHLFPRVGVALHRMPEMVSDPFELERFSLSVSSLERGWRQWHASGCPGEWFALIPHWRQVEGEHAITWSLVQRPEDFPAAARLVVLNAEAVSYHPVIGLELAPGEPYQSLRQEAQHTAWSPFDQHAETYEEHAQSLAAAFEEMQPWYRYVLRHLGIHWQIPSMELELWLRTGIVWHDAGKLSAAWQQAAARWQTEHVRRPHAGLLGRIDFEHARDGAFPCPEHAHTTARVLARALGVLLGSREAFYRGTLMALSHHHGVTAAPKTAMAPHPLAWNTLLSLLAPLTDERLLRRVDRVGWQPTMRGLSDIPPHPPLDPDAWMAYSVLVRAIRLADREIALSQSTLYVG
jgi:CRISPR-associated endonuclease/helicase Cas3